MSAYANPQYLVETGWLAEHLQDDAIRIFDCTTRLVPDPKTVYRVENCRADYDAGHIPGAGYLDLQGELSDPSSRLRFMLPSPEQFARVIGGKGVGNRHRVVLYSHTNIFWATRLWWMFRAMGHDNVAVLNGGLEKWKAEARPLSTAPAAYPPASFTAKLRPELVASKADVLNAIGDKQSLVVNALSPSQHDGSGPVHYGRPGHIKGSVNLPAVALTDKASNAYLDADKLKRLAEQIGALKVDRVMTYCGGGIAATNDAFALALIGRDDVAVYDASLSEWANDPDLPMATGKPA